MDRFMEDEQLSDKLVRASAKDDDDAEPEKEDTEKDGKDEKKQDDKGS